ncbi:regulatory protein RecX [Gynuella sp.]|uniref:regulatory protein RecX n=1 Tax=Gynuella sp. TaxID=2969146 RepID=UPI003D11CC72
MNKTPWNYALSLLARREYSRKELYQKLSSHFPDCSHMQVEDVLERLKSAGLQSDERMADAWARSRYHKGKGPLLIARELTGKGVSEKLVREALGQPEFEWGRMACSVAQKKWLTMFGDKQGKIKITRFLNSRGFNFEHIDSALAELGI